MFHVGETAGAEKFQQQEARLKSEIFHKCVLHPLKKKVKFNQRLTRKTEVCRFSFCFSSLFQSEWSHVFTSLPAADGKRKQGWKAAAKETVCTCLPAKQTQAGSSSQHSSCQHLFSAAFLGLWAPLFSLFRHPQLRIKPPFVPAVPSLAPQVVCAVSTQLKCAARLTRTSRNYQSPRWPKRHN